MCREWGAAGAETGAKIQTQEVQGEGGARIRMKRFKDAGREILL